MSESIDIEFAIQITKKCSEIRELYGIEECVREPNEQNLVEFLYDLSAFLLELECPHEDLTCGDIMSRLVQPSSRDLLSRFLTSELKTARLVTMRSIESGEVVSKKRDLALTPFIDSAIETLNVPKQANEWKVIESLRQKASGRIERSKRTPLFTATLDEKVLPEIEKQCKNFSRDFYNRLLLLNSRLKVTVESFLWNDRLKSQKEKIQSILTAKVEEIGKIKANCDVAHILSASSALRYIHKASAINNRNRTKSKQHPLSIADAPKDRGGRTEEMVGMKRETVRQQQYDRQHSHKQQKPTTGTFERPKTHEEQVLEQHTSRENHHWRGGRGRGRGRGRGGRGSN